MVFDDWFVLFAGLAQRTAVFVSASIINDTVAFEDDEMVMVHLTVGWSSFNMSLGAFPTTVVTIVDDDCKSAPIPNFL